MVNEVRDLVTERARQLLLVAGKVKLPQDNRTLGRPIRVLRTLPCDRNT